MKRTARFVGRLWVGEGSHISKLTLARGERESQLLELPPFALRGGHKAKVLPDSGGL